MDVILYNADDGKVQLEVHFEKETVWLTQDQMADLFGRERSVITKHVRNVFKEGELEEASVRAKFAHTAADGKTYQVQGYNLDVIISVGYRVKSKRGTAVSAVGHAGVKRASGAWLYPQRKAASETGTETG